MIIGIDVYNLTTTGNVGRTVTTSSGGLNEHIPIVVISGVDFYNLALTGDVAKTMNNKATDSDHIPCVLMLSKK